MKVLATCLGDCVHVAGATRFLRVAEGLGYETYFTGPATDLETLLDAIIETDADVIGVSYRLTPENLRPLLRELRDMLGAAGVPLDEKRLAFAGTPPAVAVAREFADLFEAYFAAGATVSLEVQVGQNAAPTTGDPKYTGEFIVESYKPTIETGGAVTFGATLRPATGAAPAWGTVS